VHELHAHAVTRAAVADDTAGADFSTGDVEEKLDVGCRRKVGGRRGGTLRPTPNSSTLEALRFPAPCQAISRLWARDTADGGGVRVLKFRFGSPFIQLEWSEYGRKGLVPYDAPTMMTQQVA